MADFDATSLDHIAIAINDLESGVKIYSDMGLVFSKERETVESQGVRTAFAKMDHHANLELLTPINDSSPIKKFIDKNGEGIHHICFRVPDIEKKCEELLQKGYKLIYEKPIRGAHNALVNFVHPKSTSGVLIEISEKRGG